MAVAHGGGRGGGILDWYVFHYSLIGMGIIMSSKTWNWLAFKMPRWLVYFCGIRIWANGTQGAYSDQDVTTLTMEKALERFEPLRLVRPADPSD
jgi:hypothetical protein